MKIAAPLSEKKEVELLVAAGADEFFCGIEPLSWGKKYRGLQISQRWTFANFTELAQLKEAIYTAHKYSRKVHVTVNANFYLEGQYAFVEEIIRGVLEAKADGIILADPALFSILNKKYILSGKDRIVSACSVVLNSAAVRFFKDLGVTRVILPRSLTIPEIKELISCDRLLEYETFIIHNQCFFIDGYCTYCKEQSGGVEEEGETLNSVDFYTANRFVSRGSSGGCRTRFTRERISFKDNKQIGMENSFRFWMKRNIDGCGACSIYDLLKSGVSVLKVLDRTLSVEAKVTAVRFIRDCLRFLKSQGPARAKYITYCRALFKKTFQVHCKNTDCYYPPTFL